MKKHHSVYSIDGYACRSPLWDISPVFKSVTAAAALLLCLLENQAVVSLFVILSMAGLNLKWNRIGLRNYLGLMAIPLAFILVGCAAVAADAGIGAHGWFFTITRESAGAAFNVMLRAFAAVSILYGLALSTTISQLTSALRFFHVPKVVTELMHLIYRYIFILMDTQAKIRNAAESRLGYTDFKTSCRTFGNSMGSLLILSMRRSGMYYDAMEARCYDGELLFLEGKKELRLRHILCALLYGGCMTGIGWLAKMGGAL